MITMKHIQSRSAAEATFLRTLILIIFIIGFSSNLFAVTRTWDGGGSDNNWSTAANWSGDVLPGNLDSVYVNTSGTIVDNGFTNSIQSLEIGASGSVTMQRALTLSSGWLNVVTGGVFDLGTNTLNLVFTSVIANDSIRATNGNIACVFTGTQTLQVGSDFTIGFLNLNNFGGSLQLTASSAQNLTVDSLIVADPLTIGSNVTLKITDAYVNSGGSLTNSGSLTYVSGATLYYKSSPLTTGAEWLTTGNVPENIEVNTSGTVTLNQAKSIAKNLNMVSGTLAMGANNLSVLGTVSGSEIQNGATVSASTGTFTIGNGSSSQFDQSVTGSITLPNVTVNKNHTNNNLTISGNVTVNNGNFTVTNGDVTVASGGSLTISGSNSLVLNNASTFVNNNSVSLSSGTLQLNNTSSYENGTGSTSFDANTIQLNNTSTYKTGGKTAASLSTLTLATGTTYEFNGTSGQENTFSGATFGNLTVNNANGMNIVGNVTVNGTLTFSTNALVDVTGSNTLTLSSASSVSGNNANRYVDGPLRIVINNTTTRAFPIGTSSGYRPASFQYASNPTAAQTIEMEYFASNPGGNLPSGISQIATGGYYTLQNITASSTPNYNVTLRYTDAGFSPETKTRILVQSGAGPDYSVPSSHSHDTGNDDVTASGVTALPTNTFYLAFGSGGTTTTWSASATTTDWATAANWDNGVPTSVDDAIIQSSTNDPVIGSGDAAEVNTLTIQNLAQLIFSDNSDLEVTSTASGALTVSAGGTFIINTTNKVDFNNTGYQSSATTLSGTVEYQQGTVFGDNYATLNVNGSGNTNDNGNLTVSGNFTKSGSGTFTISSDNLNVSGTSTISAGTMSTTGTGSYTLGTVNNSGGTLDIGGSAASSFGAYSGAGTISAGGSGSITFSSTFSPSGNTTFGSQTLNLQGDVTLQGGTFRPSTATSFTGTDFEANGGNVNTSVGKVTFSGSSAQTMTGALTFYDVEINNSNGVSLAASAAPTVNGTLTLTSGILDASTGSSLTLLNSTSGGSDNSFIDGAVQISTNSTAERQIATGDQTRMRVIGITPQNSTSETYTVEFFDDPYSDLSVAGINEVSQLYYWSASRSGTVNANVRVSWELNDGINGTTGLVVARYDGADWVSEGGTTSGDANSGSVLSGTIITWGSPSYVTLGTTSDDPLPVELVSFEATSMANGFVLNWETASEKDSRGFILSRKVSGSDSWEIASTYVGNSALESTNSLSGASYSYTDNIELEQGQTVMYQLEEEDIAGIKVVLQTITVESQYNTQIDDYSLAQNYPNPFNPSTTIGYELKDNAKVSLVVYNALGQAVKTLVNQNQDRGIYTVQFNASDFSSGMYFYRIVATGASKTYTEVRKMMLVK